MRTFYRYFVKAKIELPIRLQIDGHSMKCYGFNENYEIKEF